jgi:hypothetical protein
MTSKFIQNDMFSTATSSIQTFFAEKVIYLILFAHRIRSIMEFKFCT